MNICNNIVSKITLFIGVFIFTPAIINSINVNLNTGHKDFNSAFNKDQILSIKSAKLLPGNCYEPGQNIENTIDNDLTTIYHSPWTGHKPAGTIVFEYKFNKSDKKQLDYIVLYPRKDGSNGIIKKARIWVSSDLDSDFRLVQEVTLPKSSEPFIVIPAVPVQQPNTIRIEVLDAYASNDEKYFVSLAEIECYQRYDNTIKKDLKYFSDCTFSELEEKTTEKRIKKIKNPVLKDIASKLFHKTYQEEFRIQEYKPYRPVVDLAKTLKTSTYSQFENMTGIHFSKEETVIVFVGKTGGEKVKLRVKDFGKSGDDFSYPLFEGPNVLTMKGKGNGYINYYTANYKVAKPVKIHIYGGAVNGVFNPQLHSEKEGKEMLDNAVSEVLDICGEKTQLIYDVKGLKEQAYGRLGELINLYDSIIMHQHLIMGLDRYNRVPENHMLGRVVWNGYMHADGLGAAFSYKTMDKVANPGNIRANCWGIAHEFGHVNQVRPGMNWVGTSECTNNIFSAWSQYIFNPRSLRLEHERIKGVTGGRYNAYLNNALIEGQEWGLQCGPDVSHYQPDNKGQWGGDHFVKLAPLWQLHLYYHVAGEGNAWYKPYFWADIFEKVRLTDESNLTDGQLQMNFIKNACDAVQQDLTGFFLKTGFLTPIDKMFGDYRSRQKTITQEMVDEVIKYAQKYPEPQTDVIYYISGNSIEAFLNKQGVRGEYNKGISGNTLKSINHDVWKNVTVFETYHNSELKCITMVGTGDKENKKTLVPYLDGATRIEAVGWDGNRTLVIGTR